MDYMDKFRLCAVLIIVILFGGIHLFGKVMANQPEGVSNETEIDERTRQYFIHHWCSTGNPKCYLYLGSNLCKRGEPCSETYSF